MSSGGKAAASSGRMISMYISSTPMMIDGWIEMDICIDAWMDESI